MEIKKTIGKLGSLAKQKAQTTFTKENARHTLHEMKETTGEVIHEASKVRDKAANYAEKVDRNTSTSWLINSPQGHVRHEEAESFMFGSKFERTEHHKGSLFYEGKGIKHKKVKPSKQTIVININSKSKKRSRRKKRQAQFSPRFGLY
ncbi:MAG: hypothetical protein WC998_09065 [Candidatus Paceibacterota bacterium]|jgi:hypothetical protein